MSHPASLRLAGWAALAALQVPMAITIWVSFSPGMLPRGAVDGWSLRWYRAFLEDPQWSHAAARSLAAGLLAASVAVPLGTMAALGLRAAGARAGKTALALVLAPACVPAAALGLGWLQSAHASGLAGTWAALVGAHSLLGLPVAVLLARMGLSPRLAELEAAARGLGAGPWVVTRRVTLPNLAPWLLAAFAAVFMISLNDAVVAVFVCGPETETLPVVAWRQLRHAAGPLVAVAGVATLAASALGLAILFRLKERQMK